MDGTGLRGRIAVVTGGGRGLGRAIGSLLGEAGARVVAVDLPSALDDLPGGWEGEGVDLAADDARHRLDALALRLGPVRALVANAGLVPPWRGMRDLDLAEWDRVMRVNVWGVAATLGAFADSLAASGQGAAVVMASINAYRAHPRQVLYTASKHAALGVMRAAALDFGAHGVRVNALAPGPVATEALRARLDARAAAGGEAPEAALATYAAQTVLGRIATAGEVAEAARFLLSDAASALTGVVLPVEAGIG